jgi:hypothetical protein
MPGNDMTKQFNTVDQTHREPAETYNRNDGEKEVNLVPLTEK